MERELEIYDQEIRKIRGSEFPQTEGITYLDHAGATLYARSQLEAHLNDLTANLYGNPHSHNPSSTLTTDTVDYARELVLRHFNTTASDYNVIFTSGCTGALKLLCESFPWEYHAHSDSCLQAGTLVPAVINHEEAKCTDCACCGQSSRHEVLYTPQHEGLHSYATGSGGDGGGRGGGMEGEGEGKRGGGEGGGMERGRGGGRRGGGRGGMEGGGERRGREFGGSEGKGDGGNVFCYLEDNHTSVVGMREVAAQHGARIICTTEQDIVDTSQCVSGSSNRSVSNSRTTTLMEGGTPSKNSVQKISTQPKDAETKPEMNDRLGSDIGHSNHSPNAPFHLFAYPAQSNFSGRKYPLSWVKDIPSGRVCVAGLPQNICGSWLVLLDAASHVSTNPLDLSKHAAHFVTLSFYKMFGFPTGLGALLVRADCAHLLHKEYYGGGTVMATVSRKRFHLPRPQLHDRFEDGTLPFLDIVALKHGFSALQRLAGPMETVSLHTFSLARHLHHSMLQMRHGTGGPVCVVYCDTDFEDSKSQGAIVNFNLLRPDGSFVGYSEVDKLACIHDIHLRTGCFCNTGACMSHLNLSAERVEKNVEAGHVCGDNIDLVDGFPTGSVRISFGYMSTFEDAQKFVKFIEQCFVEKRPQTAEESLALTGEGTITRLSTIKATDIATQVSASSPGTDQEYGVPANLATGQNSWSILPKGGLQDSVNQTKLCYPSDGTAMKEGPRLHQDDGMVVRELQAKSKVHVSGRTEKDSTGGRGNKVLGGLGDFSDEGGSGGVLTVGDVLQIFLRGKHGLEPVEGPLVAVERIALYPVKSCGSFEVTSWQVGSRGFLFDREWMVLSEHCSVLSQKQERRLCLIQPSIDLTAGKITLSAKGWPLLEIPLTIGEKEDDTSSSSACQTRVCGDKVQGLDCGKAAAQWVSGVLGRSCRLVRRNPNSQRMARKQPDTGSAAIPISLANEAQYLLISRASVEDLHRAVARRQQDKQFQISVESLLGQFRPNLVVTGSQPYAEEEWVELRSRCGHTFKVTGQCSRCQMVCVDQRTAQKGPEPLKTLMAQRGNKVPFGIYLAAVREDTTVRGHCLQLNAIN